MSEGKMTDSNEGQKPEKSEKGAPAASKAQDAVKGALKAATGPQAKKALKTLQNGQAKLNALVLAGARKALDLFLTGAERLREATRAMVKRQPLIADQMDVLFIFALWSVGLQILKLVAAEGHSAQDALVALLPLVVYLGIEATRKARDLRRKK